MPGYVIHTAIANEYIRKNNIKNGNDIIRGTLAPDEVDDKSLTHYGELSSRPDLKKYLSENQIQTDYDKGYFLHLIADYLFYNYYFVISKDFMFYREYDMTNKELIAKYHVQLPEKFQKYMNCINDEKPKVLKIDKLEKMIDEISNINLLDAEKSIKENNYILVNDKRVEINAFKRI